MTYQPPRTLIDKSVGSGIYTSPKITLIHLPGRHLPNHGQRLITPFLH